MDTRDYVDKWLEPIDARLQAMEKRLIVWGIGIAGLVVTLVTTLDRVIPR